MTILTNANIKTPTQCAISRDRAGNWFVEYDNETTASYPAGVDVGVIVKSIQRANPSTRIVLGHHYR